MAIPPAVRFGIGPEDHRLHGVESACISLVTRQNLAEIVVDGLTVIDDEYVMTRGPHARKISPSSLHRLQLTIGIGG